MSPFSLALVVTWTTSLLLFDILVLRFCAFQHKLKHVLDFHTDGKGKPIVRKGRANLNHLLQGTIFVRKSHVGSVRAPTRSAASASLGGDLRRGQPVAQAEVAQMCGGGRDADRVGTSHMGLAGEDFILLAPQLSGVHYIL